MVRRRASGAPPTRPPRATRADVLLTLMGRRQPPPPPAATLLPATATRARALLLLLIMGPGRPPPPPVAAVLPPQGRSVRPQARARRLRSPARACAGAGGHAGLLAQEAVSEEDASLGGVRCPASGLGAGEGVEEGGGRVGAPAGVWESAAADEGAGWAGGAVEGGAEGEGAEEECLEEEVGEGILFLLGRVGGWGVGAFLVCVVIVALRGFHRCSLDLGINSS